MGGGGDQEVGESTSRLSSLPHHGGNNESVTAYGGTVERDGFESGFDFLQAGLPFGRLNRRCGQKRTGGQLGSCNG